MATCTTPSSRHTRPDADPVAGFDLSIVPAKGRSDELCFVADAPDAPDVTSIVGGGKARDMTTQGAILGTSSRGVAIVVGDRPGAAGGRVHLGTTTSTVTAEGFFVVTGNRGDAVTFSPSR